MKSTPIFLEPFLKEVIWGGNKLSTIFNYKVPSEHTGEAWVVSANEHGPSVIRSGPYKGQNLIWLWQNHRELFGSLSGDKFPLLVKIIDAKDDLSIQVHPNDSYALEYEKGSLGKTECWYVLDCEKNADIVIGHHAKDKEELYQMIEENQWDDLINIKPIQKGDFFQIDPGSVHAIRKGTLILEVQQNSDITYRLYDYNRLQDNKVRELHVAQCKDVIVCPYKEERLQREKEYFPEGEKEQLISNKIYTVDHYKLNGHMTIKNPYPFLIINIIEGMGKMDDYKIQKGDSLILPYGYEIAEVNGSIEMITSHI